MTDQQTTTLPTWQNMSDLDKGAALLHLHKRGREGVGYAVEHYPARYLEDPALTVLDPVSASRHAASMADDADKLTPVEYGRLYDVALDEETRRTF
jgi:hypothetical protein